MRLKSVLPALRVLVHGRNLGKSAALRTGIRAAQASASSSRMDGDGQNDPADIHIMIAPFAERQIRSSALSRASASSAKTRSAKRWASNIANPIRRWLLNDGARDSVCGWKAMPRDVFLALPYFDNMHRFLIALTLREGYEAKLIDVRDRPRAHGTSKYTNWGRLMVGIPDLFGVAWLMRRFRGTGANERTVMDSIAHWLAGSRQPSLRHVGRHRLPGRGRVRQRASSSNG